jgi:transposase
MSKRKFSDEFKEESVAYALKNKDNSMSKNAVKLGVGESTLCRWIQESKNKSGVPKIALSEEQKQIKELKRQLADMTEVNDILKKAHKYFVGQSR